MPSASLPAYITPPRVVVRPVGNAIAGSTTLSASLTDTGAGLKHACEVCVGSEGGCTWTEATSDFNEGETNGSCYYAWDTTSLTRGSYSYNFRAADLENNRRVGDAQHTQLIERANVTEFALDLQAGWNLISLPLDPLDSSTIAIFAPVMESFSKIYSYEPVSKNWQVYTANRETFDQPNSLYTLAVGNGYWVEMNSPATLTIRGSPVYDFRLNLREQWNYIGYPSTEERNVTSALQSIDGLYYRMYSYDAQLKRYDLHNPYASVPEPDVLGTMSPGKGYIIDMKANAPWAP